MATHINFRSSFLIIALFAASVLLLSSCGGRPDGTVAIPRTGVVVNPDKSVRVTPENIALYPDGSIIVPRDYMVNYRDTIVRVYRDSLVQVPSGKGTKTKDSVIQKQIDTLVRVPQHIPIADIEKIYVSPMYASVSDDGSGVLSAEIVDISRNEVIVYPNPQVKDQAAVQANMLMYLILFVVLVLVVAVVYLFMYRIPAVTWTKALSAGRPSLPLKMMNAGIEKMSVDKVIYILNASDRYNLEVSMQDIKANRNIDPERYIEILRISKEENLGITQRDIQEHFGAYADVNNQMLLLKYAKAKNVSLTLKEMKELSVKRVSVISFCNSVEKSQRNELGITKDEIKDLYYQGIDVDTFLDTVLSAKNDNLNLTAPMLKEFFMAKVNVRRLTDIMSVAKENNLDLSLSQMAYLPLTKIDAEKLVNVLLMSRNASMDELNGMPLLAKADKDEIVKAFISDGVRGLQRELVAQEALTISRRDLDKFVQTLIDGKTSAFKISLLDLKELSFDYTDLPKLARAYINARNNGIPCTMAQLEEVITNKIDAESFVTALIKSRSSNPKEYSIADLKKEALKPNELEKIANLFIESQQNDLRISLAELAAKHKLNIRIRPMIAGMIDAKQFPHLNINPTDIEKMAAQGVDIEKLLKSLTIANDNGLPVSIEELRTLKLAKLDIEKFFNVYILSHKEGLHLTIKELAEQADISPDIYKVVKALTLLRGSGEEIHMDDLTVYNKMAVDTERLANELLKVKYMEPAISIQRLLSHRFMIEDAEETLAAYRTVQQKDLPITLVQLTEHRTNGGSLSKVIKAYEVARHNQVSVTFEQLAAIDSAKKDPIDAVRHVIHPENIVISPIFTTTKDGIQFILKVQVSMQANIDRYVRGTGRETIEAKVREAFLSTVGGYETRKEALENLNNISATAAERLRTNRELNTLCAYDVLDISILDTTVGIDTNVRLKLHEARDRKLIAEAEAATVRAESFVKAQQTVKNQGQQTEVNNETPVL